MAVYAGVLPPAQEMVWRRLVFFFHHIRKKEEWCKPAAEKASHSSVQKPEVMLLSARRQTRAVIEIYPGLFPFALPDGCYKTQRHEVYA